MENNKKNIDVKKLLEDYQELEEYKNMAIRRNVYLARENEKLQKEIDTLTDMYNGYKQMYFSQKTQIQELQGLDKKPKKMKDYFEDQKQFRHQKEKELIPDFSYKKYQN